MENLGPNKPFDVCGAGLMWYQETSHLQNSATQLRGAALRYSDNKDTIAELAGTKGKELLVPLTGSISYISACLYF